jgi:hypothetical protein
MAPPRRSSVLCGSRRTRTFEIDTSLAERRTGNCESDPSDTDGSYVAHIREIAPERADATRAGEIT